MIRVVRELMKAGTVRPVLPRPRLLELLGSLPFRNRTIATAVQLQAALTPDETGVIDDDRSLTWAELDDRVTRLAEHMLATAGEGGRVAFMLRNRLEMVEAWCACARAGAIAVPINTWSGEAELRHVFEVQEPGLLLFEEEFRPAVEAAEWDGPSLVRGEAWEQTLADASGRRPGVRGSGRIVIHTSGTTGRPKGAEREVGGSATDTAAAFLERVPLHRTHRFFLASPLFHSLAHGMMSIGLLVGTPLVVSARYRPETFAERCRELDVKAACMVPTMIRRLLDQVEEPPSLEVLVVSGSAMPIPLRARVRERMGPCLFDLYGATEAGWATIATPDEQQERPGTVGRPAKGMAIRIVDPEGQDVPVGEIGEVYMFTGFEFEGYTRANDRSRIDGGISVGDLGRLDEEGYLYITGRADDMVISGGENIYPSEIEDVLEGSPDVRECAVVGVPDEDLGQRVVAFVVAHEEDVTPESLAAFVRERLNRYKVPREFRLVPELPRNATGKVLRRELIAAASQVG